MGGEPRRRHRVSLGRDLEELMKITSTDIISGLKVRYKQPIWVTFPEMRCGTGYGKRSEQRIDLWAINTQPHQGCPRLAFEIKVDRQDFLNELKDPLKRRGALLLSNQFFFVTPRDLVKPGEIPLECGLLEMACSSERPEGGGWQNWGNVRSAVWMREVIDAPVRETVLPTWKFVASLARRIAREEDAQTCLSTSTPPTSPLSSAPC